MDIETAILEIANKNKAAFDALYRSQRAPMVRYATGLLAGDLAAAEDAVDEGFFDIWQKVVNYSGVGSALGWIRRIIRNKAIDWLRKSRESSMISDYETVLSNAPDTALSPEENMISDATNYALKSILVKLSDEHREVIWLCYYEDKSLAQIALIMECPLNTVKTRLHHARLRLQSLITQSGQIIDNEKIVKFSTRSRKNSD